MIFSRFILDINQFQGIFLILINFKVYSWYQSNSRYILDIIQFQDVFLILINFKIYSGC